MLCSGSAAAAEFTDLPAAPERFVVDHWTTRDGLPQNSVTDIFQDHRGYLWITTFGGLARYDGHSFKVFDLGSAPGLDVARFMAVFEAADGALWLGGERGRVLRYRDDVFEEVPVPAGALGSPVSGFAQRADGTVWAASRAGPILWKDDVAAVVALPEAVTDHEVRSILVDAADRVWAGAAGGPFCVAGDCPVDGEPASGPAPHALAEHPELGLLSLNGSGLWAGHPDDRRSLVGGAAGWTGDVVHDRSQDRLWVSSYGDVYVGRESEFARVALPNEGYGVRALLVDREGSIWVGTDGAGLFQIRDRRVLVHGAAAGLTTPSVRTVLPDPDGGLWVGAGCDEIHHFRAGVFERVQLPPSSGCIGPMAVGPDDAVWFGGGRWLHRREPSGAFERFELDRGNVLTMLWSGEGWWLGRGNGDVVHYVDGEVTPVPGTEPIADVSVRALRQAPDGALWLATDHGVAILRDGVLQRIGAEDGLSPGVARALHVDSDGTAWVGTYGGGLSRIRDGRIHRFGRADGLCDNVVSAILDGGDGALWMNGNRGIFRVHRGSIDGVVAGAQERLECALLESGEGNGGTAPAGARMADGRLFFPTIAGIAEVDPAGFDVVSVPPLMTIERATVDGRPVADGAVLEPGRGNLFVEGVGLSLASRDLQFEHRLLGHDPEWVPGGSSALVRYMGLLPGAYALEMRARNDRDDPGAPAVLSFTLLPALHQRLWFPWVVVLGLFAIVSGGWSLRVAGLRRHAAELQAEIEARTRLMDQLRQAQRVEAIGNLAGGVAHDFNNVLTAAGGSAGLLRADLDGTEHVELVEEIQTAVERGADLAKRLLEFARGGELHPVPLVVAAVVDDLLPILRRVVPVRINILLEASTPGLQANLDRVELEQAVMNLVVNARDAIPDRGTIRMRVEERGLSVAEARARGLPKGRFVVLTVRDDGQGMDEDLRARVFSPFFTTKEPGIGTGLGLATVQRVVGHAGGFVRLDSEPGRGTTFELWFPALEG